MWQQRRRSRFQGDDELVFCHPQTGGVYDAERFKAALVRAFKAAGIDWPEGFRRCHDLRVTAITADANAGSSEIKVMAKAGHATMATTKRYLDLAGVVFRDEAEAQANRLLGQLSTEPSTRLSAPQMIDHDPASLNGAESQRVDAL